MSPHARWILHCINQAPTADGDVSIVLYLNDHPLLKLMSKVVRRAAVNGHFELVKWLHHQDRTCAKDATAYAARGGHPNIARWIHCELQEKE